MANRYVIYDYDEDKLVTTNAYKSIAEAQDDADQLGNVIIVCLDDVADDRTAEEIEEDEDVEI